MDNKFDGIKEALKGRIADVQKQVKNEYGKSRPFNTVDIPTVDRLWAFDKLTPEQMNVLIGKYGEQTMNQYIYEMSMLRQKRKAHGGRV